MKIKLIATAASVAALSACGGSSGSDEGHANFDCAPINGDTNWSCTSCFSPSNSSATGDGNLNSFATFKTYEKDALPSQGRITFTVDDIGGDTFPAGSNAGAAIQLPVATGINYNLTPILLNNGATVQTAAAVNISGNRNGEYEYIDIGAAVPFTGLALQIEYNTPVGLPPEQRHQIKLFEFCGDGAKR